MKARRCVNLTGIFAAALCFLVVSGCSTTRTAEQEERHYARMDYQARFVDFRTRCLALDGTVFIEARKRPLRPGMPEPGDSYYCY
ncbi:MAG: hypothetical protein AAFX56_11000 [Pseudomonadota bacterium]